MKKTDVFSFYKAFGNASYGSLAFLIFMHYGVCRVKDSP